MIEDIIKNQLVEIYFQPIVSIRSKTLFALEALTRCTYSGQFIPPDLLFTLAKEKGSITLNLDDFN